MARKGVKELEKYRKDFEPLTPKQAIHAFCSDCMGNFADGLLDCNNPRCPLYGHMPYSKSKRKVVITPDKDDS